MRVGEAAANEVEALFSSYPTISEFFIPQLAVFLLYGSFDTSRILQISILHICDQSIYFAHKFYWFINAFSLSEAGVTVQGVLVLRQLMELIERHGEQQDLPYQVRNRQTRLQECAIASLSPLFDRTGRRNGLEQSTLPQDSRDRAKDVYSSSSSNQRNSGDNDLSEGKKVDDDEEEAGDIELHSPLLNNHTNNNNALLVTNHSPFHLSHPRTTAAEESKHHPYPQTATLTTPRVIPTKGCFRNTVQFWDRMTEISRIIAPKSSSQRTVYLRELLAEVVKEYFRVPAVDTTLNIPTPTSTTAEGAGVRDEAGGATKVDDEEKREEADGGEEEEELYTSLPVYVPLANSKNR